MSVVTRLLAGCAINNDRQDARDAHVFGLRPRELVLRPEAEVDEEAARLQGCAATSSGAASSGLCGSG